jgi:hypothetical protein
LGLVFHPKGTSLGGLLFKLGLGGLARSLLGKPGLWGEAIRAALSVRRKGRLGPSRAYLRWRSQTAYGEAIAVPANDFVDYLEWRKRMRGLR